MLQFRRQMTALLIGLLYLCGFQIRAHANFAQFNLTTDSHISCIGNPGAESIWLNGAQTQLQPSANGYWHRFDFQFVGTDIQMWTFITSGVSGYKVYIDGVLTTATAGGTMPGTVSTSLDISLVNGNSASHTTNAGAGFANTVGVLTEGTHSCSIIFEATSGNTNTYLGKLFQVQGANPQLIAPSYTASSGFFPAHTFPQYIGSSTPVATSAGALPAYIRADDVSGFVNGGNNTLLQPQKPVGALHFKTIGGTAISIGKWAAGISGAGLQILTVAVDNQILPEIDLNTAGVTGKSYDWLPIATGLANVNHDVDITYSIAGSQTPGIGTIIVENGTVNTATYPAADAKVGVFGDSITLTSGQRYGTTALWVYQYKIFMAQRGKSIALVDRGFGGTFVTSLAGGTSGVSRYTDITSLSGLTEVLVAYANNDMRDPGPTSPYQNNSFLTNQAQLIKFQDHGGSTGFETMLSELATNLPLGTIFRVVGIYPGQAGLQGKGSQADSAGYFSGNGPSRQFIQAWNNAIASAVSNFTTANPSYAPYFHFYNPLTPGDPWMLQEVAPTSPVVFASSANGSTTTIISATQVAVGKGVNVTSGANAGQWSLVESVSGSGPYTMTVYPPFTASTASGDNYTYNGDTYYQDAGTTVTGTGAGSTTTIVTTAVMAVGNDIYPTSGANSGQYAQIIGVSGSGPTYTYTVQPAFGNATANGDTYSYNLYTREGEHPFIRGANAIALHMVNQVQPVAQRRKTTRPRGDRNEARHGGRN